jgi:hypothetical protein
MVMMLAATFSAGAMAQDRAPVKGDYTRIAACVWRALDELTPGNIHLVDLRGEETIIIIFESPIAGGAVRSMKASFSNEGAGLTSIEIEGPPPGYWPGKVRPIAEECSAHLPAKLARRK